MRARVRVALEILLVAVLVIGALWTQGELHWLRRRAMFHDEFMQEHHCIWQALPFTQREELQRQCLSIKERK